MRLALAFLSGPRGPWSDCEVGRQAGLLTFQVPLKFWRGLFRPLPFCRRGLTSVILCLSLPVSLPLCPSQLH